MRGESLRHENRSYLYLAQMAATFAVWASPGWITMR